MHALIKAEPERAHCGGRPEPLEIADREVPPAWSEVGSKVAEVPIARAPLRISRLITSNLLGILPRVSNQFHTLRNGELTSYHTS